MSKKPQSIRRRAANYASGKRAQGTHSGADESPLAEGWEDGYKAALRDVQRTAGVLVDTVGDELQQALLRVVTNAAEVFKEEMEKLS